MEQQIDIRHISNFMKAVAVAALLFFAALAVHHTSASRVSAPATTLQWSVDSSWVKGGWTK